MAQEESPGPENPFLAAARRRAGGGAHGQRRAVEQVLDLAVDDDEVRAA